MAGKSQFSAEMHKRNSPLSLADLAAAGIRLRPDQAVTLVRELVRQLSRDEIAGVPSSHVIRLSAVGAVSVEGPVAAGGRPILRAAQLLESLLPQADDGAEFRVPGGLRLVLARAAGTLDLPPFASLEAFTAALERFAGGDAAATITELVATYTELIAATPPVSLPAASSSAQVEPFVLPRPGVPPESPLTVSDIRRARRATGMALAKVADRSRIPVGLLRQLEWGYLANWPAGQSGRSQLVRYARATGLDEQLVISTITPLMTEADERQSVRPALVPAVAPPPPIAAEAPVSARTPEATAPDLPAVVALKTIEVAELPLTVAVGARQVEAHAVDAVDAVDDVRIRPESGDAVVIEPTETARPRRWRTRAALAVAALLLLTAVPFSWWMSTSGAPEVDMVTSEAAPTVTAPETPLATAGRVPAPAPASPPPPSSQGGDPSEPPADPSIDPPPAPATVPAEPAPAPDRSAESSDAAAATDVPVATAPPFRPVAEGAADSPAFASVGTAMFHMPDEQGGAALVRADADSRGAVLRITRIVDDTARNFHVRSSPDGKRIAFDSDRGGVRGVYVAGADGKNVRRVSGDGFAALPTWSPDGSTLAFVRASADRPAVWNIWTLGLESGALRQVTRHESGQPWGASWFADGNRLAYSRGSELVVLNLATGAERTFASPRKGRQVRVPVVSPDGRRIMFQVARDGAWLMTVEDGSMRRVLEDPTAEEFTWSPDSRRLAYHSRRSGTWGVWVAAPR